MPERYLQAKRSLASSQRISGQAVDMVVGWKGCYRQESVPSRLGRRGARYASGTFLAVYFPGTAEPRDGFALAIMRMRVEDGDQRERLYLVRLGHQALGGGVD
jgi:hypothetical protein